MVNYQVTRVKLTNIQLNKLKSAAKNKIETILRLNKKNFEDEDLPHVLFLITRQKTKIRNDFADNMSRDIKLSTAEISKIIQTCQFFCSWLVNLGRKVLKNVAISLARDNLPGLVSSLTSSTINNFHRKISGKGAVRAEKDLLLFQIKILMILLKLQNHLKIRVY